MTLPDPAPGRKPRRRGLFGPFVLLLLLIIAWSGGWYWLQGEAIRRMDAASAQMAQRGYRLTWDQRYVGGYPFRLDINLTGVSVSEPSGWALTAPELRGEAYVYRPDHWVMVAPQGLTFTRPDGGAVIVSGKAMRASISEIGARPPRIALEGYDLTFSPEAGADPYFLSAVRQANVRIMPGPNDLGGVLLHLGGTKMALQGLAARATEGRDVDMDLDLTLTKMSAFQGQDWAAAARGWSRGGGQVLVRKAQVTGGAAVLSAKGGTLHVAADGRLEGDLDATLGDITGSGQTLQGQVNLANGQASIGPLPIGPSPRIY
jgi:hypothetical protein